MEFILYQKIISNSDEIECSTTPINFINNSYFSIIQLDNAIIITINGKAWFSLVTDFFKKGFDDVNDIAWIVLLSVIIICLLVTLFNWNHLFFKNSKFFLPRLLCFIFKKQKNLIRAIMTKTIHAITTKTIHAIMTKTIQTNHLWFIFQ